MARREALPQTSADKSRYPKLWYTSEGQAFRERLWEETLEDLGLAQAISVIESMGKARPSGQ